MSGPQDGDKDAVDPFAGLADGYEGDDELMLEALGLKPAPPAPSRTAPPAPSRTAPPAPVAPAASAGPMSPDVLNAILAAIPDAVRSAIQENGPPAAAPVQQATRAPEDAVTQSEVDEADPQPVAEVNSEPEEPTPEFELAPELAAFMEDDPPAPSPAPDEEAGIELAPEASRAAPEPELDGSGKLQGLLGRIRGKPASEIARGPGGPGPGQQTGSPVAGAVHPSAAKQISNLKLQLETAKAEVDKARKKLSQLQAETITFRKRLGEQVKEGNVRGREDVFKAVITVFDSIDSALKSSKDTGDFDTLYAGVEMIERQLHQALKPLGLTGVDAAGEKFDPSQHEAMRMTNTGKGAPGTVVEQIRKGYRAGDKLIRPALVIVEAQPGTELPSE